MSVPDGPLLTEEEFDRLTKIFPDLTAMQLWATAETFERRIVALPKIGGNGAEADTERADQDEPNQLRIGFHA